MAKIVFRPFTEADRDFVRDSFVYSFGRSAYAERIPAKVLVDALLEPCLIGWDTTIAVSSTDPDVAVGWICASAPNLVAWLYVKPHFRGAGVARALLKHAGIGKSIETCFMPTKGPDDSPFLPFAQAHGYRVLHRPHLPHVIAHLAVEEVSEN